MVQDTPDDEPFEAFSIDTSVTRFDGVNKKHMKHVFDEPEERKKLTWTKYVYIVIMKFVNLYKGKRKLLKSKSRINISVKA